MSDRDSIYIECQEIELQMRGISSRLQIYSDLKKKLEDLYEKIGNQKRPVERGFCGNDKIIIQ